MDAERVEDAYAAGQAVWPGLAMSRDAFARGAANAANDADGSELFICIAIATGTPGAIEAFEGRYFVSIAPALAGRGATRSEIDEITQQVRLRLLAPRDDGSLPIVQYAGRGQLDGLVRVTAIRAFLNAREKSSREVESESWLSDLVAPDLDGPGQVLAAEERSDVAQAIADALGGLTARDRALLRMHFLNGLGIDPIAKMLGVHRATAARQLAKVKEQLVVAVRTTLSRRWGDSAVLARVASRVDLSLERLLVTKEARPDNE